MHDGWGLGYITVSVLLKYIFFQSCSLKTRCVSKEQGINSQLDLIFEIMSFEKSRVLVISQEC